MLLHKLALLRQQFKPLTFVWLMSSWMQMCERVATQMSQLLTVPERKLTPVPSTATSQLGRAGLVEELQRIPGAPDPVLLETLPKGVALHHASIGNENRKVCTYKSII